MKSTQSFRQRQYQDLFRMTPKNKYGDPVCHCCQMRVATQQHERINRYQTPEHSIPRVLSYKSTLCNYLCPECHDVAETITVEQQLWEASARIYGQERVLRDLQSVRDAMLPGTIIVHLPEGWNG